ncbi:flagellin Hag [Oceanobacillus halotolerans]|uniref:flagellin Hag n=1 Tax=Oceanobacillus halotolerans TaxID=2663380 RepID=UPI0013DBB7CA|nr:flagellin Hag [Oceanobacillus halotolerans]
MQINHNIAALNAHRQLGANQGATQNSLEKLSSGLRINKAGDDAAGLAISEKMRGQIRGLEQASRNAQDGISLIQTAEGALNETHSILQRMRELAVQSANDTNDDSVDRAALNQEFSDLADEITRISEDTKFNGKDLLNGSASFEIHVGADADQAITVALDTTGFSASDLSVDAETLSLDSQENADTAITEIQTAIDTVSTERGKLGAFQNRLEHTINNLGTSAENLTAAESRIRDVDMASEMMEFTKNNILSQAAQSMLAQANQQPQGVLQLLQ